MEFLTDHLLELRLTRPGPMDASTNKQHDNFARQLSSLEKLLVISHAKFSVEELYKNLKLVLKAGNKGMLKISSINSLIECIELYKISAAEEEAERVSKFFEDFFKELAHLAKIKRFFHNTVYHCLYEYFYDPLQDDSDDDLHPDGLSDDDDEDDKSDNETMTSLTDQTTQPDVDMENDAAKLAITADNLKLNINTSKPVKRKKKRKSKQNLLKNVKKKKRVDNRMQVLERIQREKAIKTLMLANQKLEEPQSGKEFEKLKSRTDQQRLAFATKRMFAVQNSWNELITQGPIRASNFDEDSARTVRDYKNYLAFECVFRLIPDMLVKGFKLVELSKIWYNCSRRLGGTEPVHYQTIEDFFETIRSNEKSLELIDKEMQSKRELRVSKQTERKMLVNQILRFDELKDKYDQCVDRERELKEYYKQLKTERNSEYPKLDKLSRDDAQYKECYDQIQYLADSMKGVYRELQTASYELELVKQDYTLEMGTRAHLIRLQDDVKSSMHDIDVLLPLNEKNRLHSIHTCEKLRINISLMWMALYKSKANEKLVTQADNILQRKYSEPMSINSPSNTVANDSPQNISSDDEAELERTLDNALASEMDREMDRENSQPSTDLTASPDSPPPPLPPKKEPETPPKRQSTMSAGFNPSTAGILDQHEAKEYRQRVDRLKKKFELDLSGLKTTVDCHVDGHPNKVSHSTVESGDEADMDSDQEDKAASRPQSKKLTRRHPGSRYSPLSDASDDYMYQQQHTLSAKKTVYILKKSSPREPPRTRYILKSVPGAKFLPQKTIYKQQNPSDFTSRPKPLERKWGNDYESLQALDSNFMDSLSIYKTSPMNGKSYGNSLTPIQPLQHQEGIFTPNLDLSDGDISIDSGTGNSLDSADEGTKGKKGDVKQNSTGYKHKPRIPVRQQFTETKLLQNAPNKRRVKTQDSKLPTLQSKIPKKKTLNPTLRVNYTTSPSKSSPESLESRPIIVKKTKFVKPAARSTLQARKPVKPLPLKQVPPKPSTDTHPLAPTHKVVMNKGLQRKLPLGKLPKSFQQPSIVPRKPAKHVQILESASDDDIDEIFKQSLAKRTLPPKPSERVGLAPTKTRRKYGIRYSLAKVH